MSSDPVVVIESPSAVSTLEPAPAKVTTPYRNKTWREAAGQKETSARLGRLPPGVAFPDDFPEPIAYDAARRLLTYRGFMYHGSYVYLRQLSGDSAYLTALNEVYLSSACPPSTRRPWRYLLAVVTAAALIAAGVWWLLR